MAASHTHSAPTVRDEYPQGPPAWEQIALEKIDNAIQEASKKSMQDARIGTGTGSVYVAHNRLRTNPDGSVTWFERNRLTYRPHPLTPPYPSFAWTEPTEHRWLF